MKKITLTQQKFLTYLYLLGLLDNDELDLFWDIINS